MTPSCSPGPLGARCHAVPWQAAGQPWLLGRVLCALGEQGLPAAHEHSSAAQVQEHSPAGRVRREGLGGAAVGTGAVHTSCSEPAPGLSVGDCACF